MEEVYACTARFMERNEEFQKNLRQALVMPLVVLFFLSLAIIFYSTYIFPKTAELFLRCDIELPLMTAAVLDIILFLIIAYVYNFSRFINPLSYIFLYRVFRFFYSHLQRMNVTFIM